MMERISDKLRLVLVGGSLILANVAISAYAQTQVGGSSVIVDYSVIDQLGVPQPIYNPYAALPVPYGAYVYRQGYSYGGYGSPALVYPSVGGVANQPLPPQGYYAPAPIYPGSAYTSPSYSTGDVTLRAPKRGSRKKLGENDIFVPEVKPFVPGNPTPVAPVGSASPKPKVSQPVVEAAPPPTVPPAPSNDVPQTVPSAASASATTTAPAATAGQTTSSASSSSEGATPAEQQAQAPSASKAPETPSAPPAPAGLGRFVYGVDVDELPQGADKQLDELATKMTGDENLRIQILAYASGTPETESKARRRSLARGLNVRAYLIGKGIRSTRIEIRALGIKVPDAGPADRVDILPAAS